MTNLNSFNLSEQLKVIVFSKEEIEKEELDNKNDLKDLISLKIKTDKFDEIFSGWSEDDRYFVIVIKV